MFATIPPMNYAVTLKSFRKKEFFSQTELAKMLGVSYATVNRWENGHHEPTMRQKRAIRDLLRQYGFEEEPK